MYALAIAMLILQIISFEAYQIRSFEYRSAFSRKQGISELAAFAGAIRSVSSDVCGQVERGKVDGYRVKRNDVERGLEKTSQLWLEQTAWCDSDDGNECLWGAIVKGQILWTYSLPRYKSSDKQYAELINRYRRESPLRHWESPKEGKAGIGIWPPKTLLVSGDLISQDLPTTTIPNGSIVRYESICTGK
jgi:hypothetical protein